MKTSEEIRKIADDIEQILHENNIATANPSAVCQLESQHERMRAHCYYCAEKAGKISELAEFFYSANKHESRRNGAEGVLREMRMNLELIRSWANVWERNGK